MSEYGLKKNNVTPLIARGAQNRAPAPVGPADDHVWREKAQDALRRLEDITRLTTDWIWEADADIRLSFVSPRAQDVLGFHPLELTGKSLLDVGRFVGRGGETVEPSWHSAFRDMAYKASDKDGNTKHLRMSAVPVFCPESGKFKGVRGIAEDITEGRKNRKMLERLSTAIEQSPVLVVITNTEGDIEYVNPKFVETTGYEPQEIIGKTSEILTMGHASPEDYKAMWSTVSSGKEWRGELHNRKKNGEEFWLSQSISPIRASDGTITHFVAVGEDITARKFYEERILRQSQYDSLTNLPNRTLLFDRLSRAQMRAQRDGRCVALMFVDLDRFKLVNDTFGHDLGDQFLRDVAERLSRFVGPTDTIARLGSDEFTIVLADLADRYQVAPVVSKIVSAMGQPFFVEGTEFHVQCSIGVAVYPEDGDDHYALLKNADSAMREAKKLGGNTYRFFKPELNERATEYLLLGGQLRHALDRQELELWYQPVVDLRSGQIVGAESLMRWRHPELGMVPPDKFIGLMEESGLIEPIGEWALETACKQNRDWRDKGHNPLRIAVNISPVQLKRGRLVKAVSNALDAAGLSPESLALEVTESTFMDDMDETNAILRELSGMGMAVYVDDFGTGYSSLSYLRSLPLTTLKIDRSFVKDVTVNADAAAITEAIVGMAHTLNLNIIAEGVETMEQLQFLRKGGCEMMQGFFFSAPLPASDFVEVLREDRRLPAGPDLFSWLTEAELVG